MASSPFSLRLSPELKERLDAVADSEDRSASYVATKAIEAFLDARDAKDRAIDAAFREADKGIFVSQEAVHRWMDSWDTENELPFPEPDIFPEDERR
jgi:predicted transcriptional regulator